MTEPTTAILSIGLVFRCFWKAILYYNVIGMLLAAVVATHQEAKIWQNNNKKTNKTMSTDNDLIPLNIMGHAKVFLFNLCWYIGCLLGSIYICCKYIVTLGKSDIGYDANRCVEAAVANFVVTAFVGKVQVVGHEHLKSLFHATTTTKTTSSSSNRLIIPAPIFVANHCSQLDIGAVYRIFDNDDDNKTTTSPTTLRNNMRFKWIAKHSVLYLPGVGPLMWLGDHVLIYRRPSPSSSPSSPTSKKNDNSSSSSSSNSSHKASVTQLFVKSNEALQSGIAMFLFPQGTRRMTRGTTTSTSTTAKSVTSTTTTSNNENDTEDAHLPFKDGAFIMAEDNGSPLIPISIIIPRDNSCWNSWYPLHNMVGMLFGGSSAIPTPTIRLVIHEPVLAVNAKTQQKRTRQELKQLCYDAIYSVKFDSGNSVDTGSATAETAKNK